MTASLSDETPSPCIGVCVMNAQTRLCDGCYRSIDEITEWWNYSPGEKRRVIDRTRDRREHIANGTFFD